MTILLAAIFGNVLAWCVHVITWWLREKCLWLMGVCGLLVIVPFVCLGWLLQHFDMPIPGPNPPSGLTFTNAEIHRQIAAWCVVLSGFALLGCWHGWILKNEGKIRYLFAIGAVFAETIVALLLGISIYGALWPTVSKQSVAAYISASFLLSLLLLAIFRPLVVRYSQRFLELMKSTKSETSGT